MSGLTTILHLATCIKSLTCHYILIRELLDLPLCMFDASKCDMAETVLRRVLRPVLLRTFPELQETEAEAEDIETIKILVRRVVDLQNKVESVRTALQAKVNAYHTVLEELSALKL